MHQDPNHRTIIWLAAVGLLSACASSSLPQPGPQPQPTSQRATGAVSTVQPQLSYDPAVEKQVAQFAPTALDFDEKLVSATDRKVLVKLVAAAQLLDEIFLEQVSAENPALRQQLVAQQVPRAVLDYFDIMYGPWDRLHGDRPFVGTRPKPLGAGFYPEDLTAQGLEAWLKAHPDDEAAFRGYFSLIRREDGQLIAIPYSQAYGPRLQRAAALLREAAALSTHPALKRYLSLRAEAFLSNDYLASDIAWMDLGDSPLEVVLGPYEVYEDRLMGYKASFEAFLTLRDPEYSARLQVLARYNDQVEQNLPLAREHRTKRGVDSPISVVIELFAAGDTRAGVQTAAFNLPNDERVRAKKGSKKVMLKNVTEAKFNTVLMPIAERVLDSAAFKLVGFDPYFTDILLHEMAHGMGPGEIRVQGRATSVNRELKELYSIIEECKADIVGLLNGAFLVRKNALPAQMAHELPATYLAGIFRAVRFGTEEAHAKAVLLAYNYLRQGGAITYAAESGRFGVQEQLFAAKVRELAGKLLLVEAQGDYAGAQQLLETYGGVPPELKQALSRLADVPVDIRPRYTILDKLKAWSR